MLVSDIFRSGLFSSDRDHDRDRGHNHDHEHHHRHHYRWWRDRNGRWCHD
jgi:hypothetical protein